MKISGTTALACAAAFAHAHEGGKRKPENAGRVGKQGAGS